MERENRRKNIIAIAKTKIGVLFDSYENGQKRIDDLRWQIDRLEFLENKETMKKELEKCINIETKKKFVDEVITIIMPFIELKLEKPELFMREAEADREFMKLNELLSYEIKGDSILIHMVPGEKVENFVIKFKAGLQKLAEILNENKNIETIQATSWIIAKHPKLIERSGFVIDGEISKKIREEHFFGDKSKISQAHILRNDFLEKYLVK
ncbi:MAG: hypothetical protein WC608_00200 [Parcubacteria group bacterium]